MSVCDRLAATDSQLGYAVYSLDALWALRMTAGSSEASKCDELDIHVLLNAVASFAPCARRRRQVSDVQKHDIAGYGNPPRWVLWVPPLPEDSQDV